MLKAGITGTQEISFNLHQGLLHVPVDITIGKMHPSFTMFLEKRKSSHFKIIETLLFYFGRYHKKPCSQVFTLYSNKVLHSHWNKSHFEVTLPLWKVLTFRGSLLLGIAINEPQHFSVRTLQNRYSILIILIYTLTLLCFHSPL